MNNTQKQWSEKKNTKKKEEKKMVRLEFAVKKENLKQQTSSYRQSLRNKAFRKRYLKRHS